MPTANAGKLAAQGFDVRVIAGKLPLSAEERGPERATFLPAPAVDAGVAPAIDTASGGVSEVA
jgi:hypothetical protein